MQEILKLKYINKLKEVYRFAAVGNRKESAAEHSWSSLLVADFVLAQLRGFIDRLRVYELLMYHDLVEIEVGDTPLIPGQEDNDKREKELEGARSLKEKLPQALQEKYVSLFSEFENQETREAKIAKIIDALDADIHELDYKDDWKGWTREFYVSKRAPLFADFPELSGLFDGLVEYLSEGGYLGML